MPYGHWATTSPQFKSIFINFFEFSAKKQQQKPLFFSAALLTVHLMARDWLNSPKNHYDGFAQFNTNIDSICVYQFLFFAFRSSD